MQFFLDYPVNLSRISRITHSVQDIGIFQAATSMEMSFDHIHAVNGTGRRENEHPARLQHLVRDDRGQRRMPRQADQQVDRPLRTTPAIGERPRHDLGNQFLREEGDGLLGGRAFTEGDFTAFDSEKSGGVGRKRIHANPSGKAQ
ncbi:hypothetical protein [Herbidospora sp. RD11066]